MYCESYQTYKIRNLGISSLVSRDMYSGKPYEGKPHVRFDEGSRETGWQRHCALVLLYKPHLTYLPKRRNAVAVEVLDIFNK